MKMKKLSKEKKDFTEEWIKKHGRTLHEIINEWIDSNFEKMYAFILTEICVEINNEYLEYKKTSKKAIKISKS